MATTHELPGVKSRIMAGRTVEVTYELHPTEYADAPEVHLCEVVMGDERVEACWLSGAVVADLVEQVEDVLMQQSEERAA